MNKSVHVVLGPRLEPCEWNGQQVFITEGCWQDGNLLCGVFSSEDAARSEDPDSMAIAIVSYDSLTNHQKKVAVQNSARL